ncbi:MAG: hypothetical protein PVG39_01975 [Desulfobacteraceae bacterium]|jgi:methyl-accepting chemotaxis protein
MDEISGIVRETIAKISELKAPLEMVSAESEPQFVNLGTNLQDIFSGAEGLTSLTRETAMLIDGESNENILGNIGEFSRESLAKLNICREDVENVLPKVETCSANLKLLYDMCPVIRTIAKKLNIVALHISMESSRSRECEEMFNFFVKEIKQLASKVHEISARIRDDSENARTNQVADFSSISERKDILSSLADNAHHSVEENVHYLEDLIKMALKTMRRAEIHSKKISSLVGEVVVAIQFHDIARQQIEHVIETLDEIRTFFNKDISDENSPDENQLNPMAKAYTILSLQAEQINQVIREIHDAYKKTKKSFHEIGNEVDVLVSGMIGLSKNTDDTNYTGNPFQRLISGLDQLEKIMHQGKEMARVIDNNLRMSAETAENLASHLTEMEDISMDLHIKAINALIMSKRLGSEGKTLSVLAEDVTEVSLDSNEFVLDVVKILKAIGGLATNLSCLSDQEGNYLDDTDKQMNLSTGINMVTVVYDDFLSKSTQSIEQSKELRDKIIRLETELDFLKEIENTLYSQQDNIKNIMESIKPYIPDNLIKDNELEHLTDRYTMEVERGIHNRTLKKESIPAESLEKSNSKDMVNPDKNEEDYLGDNIELF